MNRRLSTIACTIVLLILWSSPPTLSQSADSSVTELWTDVGLRLVVSEKLSATFTQNIRFDDGMSRRHLTAPELSLKYKLTDWWHLVGGYRFENERDNDAEFQDRHRIAINTRFLAKFRPATLEYRIQWQEKFRQDEDDGTPRRYLLRMRGKAKLRGVPIVSPYASVEMFKRLDGMDDDIPAGTVLKWRFALCVEWQHGPIEFNARYYRVLPKHDPDEPSTDALGVGIRFDFAPFSKDGN